MVKPRRREDKRQQPQPEAFTGETPMNEQQQEQNQEQQDQEQQAVQVNEEVQENQQELQQDTQGQEEVQEEVTTKLVSEIEHDQDPFVPEEIASLGTEPGSEPEAPKEEAAPVVAPLKVEQPAQEEPKDLTEEEAYVEKIRVSGTDEQKSILAAVETFESNMKPRVEIPSEVGVRYQYEFLKWMLRVIEQDYETFRGCWNVLLVFFFARHGVNSARNYSALSEYSTTRFLSTWTRGEDKLNAYVNLITLLRSTRNKDTRAHDIKRILLERVAPGVISEKGLSNLKKFYNV